MPRSLAFLGLVVLLVCSLVPSWKICWTGDGAVCACPDALPCNDQDRESSPGSSSPECTDLVRIEGLLLEREVERIAVELFTPVSMPLLPGSLLSPLLSGRPTEGAPPSLAPMALLVRPLLC